eukprot:6200401-Pleurochrysis_carterae.AAC.2
MTVEGESGAGARPTCVSAPLGRAARALGRRLLSGGGAASGESATSPAGRMAGGGSGGSGGEGEGRRQ